MILKPQLIEIKKIEIPPDDFSINVFELTRICPFDVKRIYTLMSGGQAVTRGNHAHLNQSQLLYLLHGQAAVTLTDTADMANTWSLSDKCLFIPAGFWIELSMSEHSTVLCLASQPFADLITVFDKSEFLNRSK